MQTQCCHVGKVTGHLLLARLSRKAYASRSSHLQALLAQLTLLVTDDTSCSMHSTPHGCVSLLQGRV